MRRFASFVSLSNRLDLDNVPSGRYVSRTRRCVRARSPAIEPQHLDGLLLYVIFFFFFFCFFVLFRSSISLISYAICLVLLDFYHLTTLLLSMSSFTHLFELMAHKRMVAHHHPNQYTDKDSVRMRSPAMSTSAKMTTQTTIGNFIS